MARQQVLSQKGFPAPLSLQKRKTKVLTPQGASQLKKHSSVKSVKYIGWGLERDTNQKREQGWKK